MWKCTYTEHFSPFNAFEYVLKLYSLNYYIFMVDSRTPVHILSSPLLKLKLHSCLLENHAVLSPLGLQYPMSTAMSAAEYLRCTQSVRGLPVPLADQLTLILLSGHLTNCTEWQLWKLITLKITGSCIFLPTHFGIHGWVKWWSKQTRRPLFSS